MSRDNRYSIRKTTLGVASVLIVGLILTTTTLVSQFLGEESVNNKKEEVIIEKKKEVESKKNITLKDVETEDVLFTKDGKLSTGEEVIENKISETENEEIPFKVIKKLSADLLVGEEKITVIGVNGIQEKENIKTYQNNVLVNVLTRYHVLKEPVNQEVLVGSKSIETKIENVVEALPVIYVEDVTLEEGKERIIENGENSEVQKIYKETRIEGQLVNRELLEIKVIKSGIPKKVAKGSIKVETEIVNGLVTPITQTIRYIDD